MSLIYITRHGETELNMAYRFQGATVNSKLTDRGRAQAIALGKELKGKFKKVYCSDAQRAIDTAELIIGDEPIEIKTDAGLQERNWGEWDGMKHQEVYEMLHMTPEYAAEHPLEFQPKTGETCEMFATRVVNCFKNIVEDAKGEDVLIVTHCLTCDLILSYVQGIDVYKGETDHCFIGQASISIVEDKDGFRVIKENDVSHLKEAGFVANS